MQKKSHGSHSNKKKEISTVLTTKPLIFNVFVYEYDLTLHYNNISIFFLN